MINGWRGLSSYFIAITISSKTGLDGMNIRPDEGNQLDKLVYEAILSLV